MNKKQKKILVRIIIVSIIYILLRIFGNDNELLMFVLYLVPYLIIGYDIVLKAFKGIIKGQVFDENFLMVVATIGAFGLKEFEESVMVMLLYQIGELFQSIAINRSRKNISELMDIRPDYAYIEKDNELIKVDPQNIKVDDEIIVKVGDKVPLDGVVIDGYTTLNVAALTGESTPLEVKRNSEVLSGSINMESPIKVKVKKEYFDSTASKILDLIENATSNKSDSENFISKFAKYYTPVVCGFAITLGLIVPLFIRFIFNGEYNFSTWINRALTFLVISCPCALVISVPLSFFGGIGGASNQGILIKGSNYLEKLAKTDIIAFDKTGTMTKGIFEVKTIHNNLFSKIELLEYAAIAEMFSNHPIAKSIIKEYGKQIDKNRIKSIKEIPGQGIKAIIDDNEVIVGNEVLLNENGISTIPCNDDGSIVHLSINKEYKGHIHIGDIIKSTSKETINKINKMNIETIMLTGDDEKIANKVAKEIGINKVFSNLLPEDKVKIIDQFDDNKKTLVFVGDGINDAPVLLKADLGISMGALGSDAAIEAADIILMDDNPIKIPKAIGIAKKTMRIVYENIYFSIIVKIICLILGAIGYTSMWLAIFADVGVMIIAVLNALRCLNTKSIQ